VHFAGGQWLGGGVPRRPSSDVLVISCAEDKRQMASPTKSGVRAYDAELLLSGLLRHRLDLEENKLDFE